MKKIIDIYKDYKIMPNLVDHQMRVASVAMQICESISLEIDKESVIKACLLHDMGNLIKFDLNYFPEFYKPHGLEYWKIVQGEYIDKYGNNEKDASILIAKEIGVSKKIINLISTIDSSIVESQISNIDICKMVCIYSDSRVSPSGIVSIEERSIEARDRYKNHPSEFTEQNRTLYTRNMSFIENKIFMNSSINPIDINNNSTKYFLKKLKDYIV